MDEWGKETPIAFVGAGRLGSSLAQAAASAGYLVVSASSRRAEHRAYLRRRLPGIAVFERPFEAAEMAKIVFISTSDMAIETACAEVRWRPGMAAVHCSGAMTLETLDAARLAGARIGGFHPLQTFPSPDCQDRLAGVSISVETADQDLKRWLLDLATALGCDPFEIAADQRSAYHASAVMSGSLVAGLAGIAAEMWSALGITREDALKRLAPLITSVAANVKERGLPAAMTGPFVRGEVETVRRHLHAAAAQSPGISAAYSALALAQLHIAFEQGGLSAQAYQAMVRLLAGSLRESVAALDEMDSATSVATQDDSIGRMREQ